jgi:hypothetical protein
MSSNSFQTVFSSSKYLDLDEKILIPSTYKIKIVYDNVKFGYKLIKDDNGHNSKLIFPLQCLLYNKKSKPFTLIMTRFDVDSTTGKEIIKDIKEVHSSNHITLRHQQKIRFQLNSIYGFYFNNYGNVKIEFKPLLL